MRRGARVRPLTLTGVLGASSSPSLELSTSIASSFFLPFPAFPRRAFPFEIVSSTCSSSLSSSSLSDAAALAPAAVLLVDIGFVEDFGAADARVLGDGTTGFGGSVSLSSGTHASSSSSSSTTIFFLRGDTDFRVVRLRGAAAVVAAGFLEGPARVDVVRGGDTRLVNREVEAATEREPVVVVEAATSGRARAVVVAVVVEGPAAVRVVVAGREDADGILDVDVDVDAAGFLARLDAPLDVEAEGTRLIALAEGAAARRVPAVVEGWAWAFVVVARTRDPARAFGLGTTSSTSDSISGSSSVSVARFWRLQGGNDKVARFEHVFSTRSNTLEHM